MQKRGLSEVIVSIMLVVLVLVAISIVWVFIRAMLQKSSEEISLDKITTDIVIEKQQTKIGLADLTVSVKRNAGKGDLSGIRFLLSNGTKTFEYTSLQPLNELESKLFVIPFYPNLTGTLKTIQIAPVIQLNNGKISAGGVADEQDLSILSTDYGDSAVLILDPESSLNPCTKQGTANFGLDSQRGNVLILDGNGYLDCGNKPEYNFGLTNSFTILMWVNSIYADTYQSFLFAKSYDNTFGRGYGIYIPSSGTEDTVYLNKDTTPYEFALVQPLKNDWQTGTWKHIAMRVNRQSRTIDFIIDGGVKTISGIYSQDYDISGTQKLLIGAGYIPVLGEVGYNFKGRIDNFIIFNRSLSDAEVHQIYLLQK